MFGYITPIIPELEKQDFVLYRAFYCGICVASKKYGQLSRFMTNYDMTFLAIFTHDQLNQSVEFKEIRCVGGPFIKRPIIDANPLLNKIVAINIILGYYNIIDDIIDSGRAKSKMLKNIYKKAYNKAKELVPQADEIVSKWYNKLREGEKKGEESIDRISHCFSQLLTDIVAILLPNMDDNAQRMCYNIGKFVYLIDALDDIDEDFKKKRYNPILARFKNYSSRRQFFTYNQKELDFIFASTVNRIIACFNELKFTQSYNLMRNIIYRGLRAKVQEVFSSDKKLRPPKI